MKKTLTLLMILLSFVQIHAQLTVDNTSMTVAQFVQNVLVGTGVTVTNVQFNGGTGNVVNGQVGSFVDVNSNTGLANGVILGSGDVTIAAQLNIGGGSSQGGSGNLGVDTDLASITPNQIWDECIVEFDFVPQGDSISFRYVFASEEYDEFVCGTVNDAFGFFLSGAIPTGGVYTAQNLALIPDPANPGTFTNTPVSINTVNLGTAVGAAATECITIDPNFAAYNVFYTQNTTNTYEYDGKTVVLTATAPVICGNTYHIKLAIGDGGDGGFDSGVFLEAGSFSSDAVALVSNFDVSTGDSVLFEGCGTAMIDFVRSDTSDTAVFYYNITGSANPLDYNVSSPDSVTFLPGESVVTVSFAALSDGVVEPLESINIELPQVICNVLDTTIVSFYIGDYQLALTTTPDVTVSCTSIGLITIGVDVFGPEHTTMWSTGQTADSILVSPQQTTTYYVTVADTCGVSTITDSVTVFVNLPPPIVISTSMNTTTFCPQDTIQIGASATGGLGNYSYSWTPAGLTSVGDSILVSPDTTTTYFINVQGACNNSSQDSVTVIVPTFVPLTNVITTNDTAICEGEAVSLDAVISGGVGTTFSWDNGLGSVLPISVTPLVNTDYILTAQDLCGVVVSDTVSVSSVVSSFGVNVPDYTMTCLNEVVTLSAQIANGLGTESYLWSTGDTTTTIQVSPTITTDYTFNITDGCTSLNDTATITVPIFNPLAITVNNDVTTNCPGDPITLFANFSGGALSVLDIIWDDSTTTFTGNSIVVNPLVTTTYTAFILDTCAFDSAEASFTVTVPNYDPLEILLINDTAICKGDTLQLVATAIGGEGTYTYDWDEGSFPDSILNIQPIVNESYLVNVIDGCGTQADSSVSVNVQQPVANFTYEYISDFTVEFTDSSFSNIVSNHWVFVAPNDTANEINPTYTYMDPGSHLVLLVTQDNEGCQDTIVKTIIPPNYLYSPTAFTPDGDGLNEKFMFKGIGVESFQLLVYNRWGELIYESNDISEGWDGTKNDELLPVGVYSYQVKTKFYNGASVDRAGVVTIVR